MQRIVQLTDDEWLPMRDVLRIAIRIRDRAAAQDYKGAMHDPRELEPARLLGTDLKALIDSAEYIEVESLEPEDGEAPHDH